jgi:hypothetical protein
MGRRHSTQSIMRVGGRRLGPAPPVWATWDKKGYSSSSAGEQSQGALGSVDETFRLHG